MTRSRQRRADAGASLLELLVAMVVVGILASALFEAARTGGLALRRHSAAAEDAETLAVVGDALRRGLASAIPAMRTSADGRRRALFVGGPDHVLFVVHADEAQRLARRGDDRAPPALTAVGIAPEGPEGAPRLAATPLILLDARGAGGRAPPTWDAAALAAANETQSAALLPDDMRLRFAYFGARVRESGPTSTSGPVWGDDWRDQSRLPMLVHVALIRDGAPAIAFTVAPRLAGAT